MRKVFKRISIVLAFAIVVGVFAGIAPAQASQPLKAAMITPQKLGDDGPIDALYAGLQQGAEEFGYTVKLLEPESG